VSKKLVAAAVLFLGLAIVLGVIRTTPWLRPSSSGPAETPASPALPPEEEQIAAIKQLNDTFFEVMSEYSAIRQEFAADSRKDRDSRFAPRVEALYKKISGARREVSLFKVSPQHQQALEDAQQNSLYLAGSIFSFYDALLAGGEDRKQQMGNSSKDFEKAMPYYKSLSVARQDP
jgi:hypothetical protein